MYWLLLLMINKWRCTRHKSWSLKRNIFLLKMETHIKDAGTHLWGKLLSSGGNFLRRSLGDRCTGNPPLLSLCRWRYQHKAWTSTGGYLSKTRKQTKESMLFLDLSVSPSQVCASLCLCQFFSLSFVCAFSLTLPLRSILSPSAKLRTQTSHVTHASSSSAPKRISHFRAIIFL